MTDRSRFRNSGGFGGRGGRGRGGRGRGRGGGRQDRTTPRGGGRSGNPRAGNPTETRGRGRGRGGRGGQGGQGRPAPNNPASARFSRRPVGTQVSGKQSILQEIAKASDLKVNAKDVQPAYELLCKKYNPDKELFKEPEMQSLSFIIPTMVKATDAYEQAFRSGKPITQDRFREYKAQFVQLLFMKFAPGENITQEYQEKRAKVCTCLIQICGKLQDFRNANRYAKMWLSKLAPWVETTSRDDASLSQSFNLMIVQTYVNPFVKHVASTALKSLPRGRAAVSIRRASAQIDNLLFAYAFAEFDRWSKETDPTAFKPLPVSFKRLQDEFVKVAKCLRQLHLREAKELPAAKPKEQEPKEPTVENKMLVPPGLEDKTGSKDSKVAEGPKAPRQNFPLWALKKPADLEVEQEKKRQAAQEARKKKIQDAKDEKIAALKNAGRKPVEEVAAVSHKAGDWVKANEKGEIVLLKAFESKHAGKLLFTEAPLVVKFNRGAGRYCANCYRVNRSARAVKCAKYEKCRVMFCGSKCAEAALTNGRHGTSLCGDKYHGQSLGRHSHLILQLISMSGGLNNFVTKFQSVFDAKVNAQAKLVDLLGLLIVKWTLKTLKPGQSQDDLPINNSVLIDTYQLIKTLEKSAPEGAPVNVPENAVKLLYKMLVFLRNFPQSQISIQGRAAGGKRGKGRKVSQNQNGKPTKDRAKSVPLGTALGSIGGLMAFSCDPVLKRSLNTATGLIEYRVIRANAKLEEGKVLTVSYGLQGSKGRKRGGQGGQTFQQQRKQDIEKRFGIVCTCTVCSTVGAAGGGSTLAGTSPSTSTGGSFQSANISPRSSLY